MPDVKRLLQPLRSRKRRAGQPRIRATKEASVGLPKAQALQVQAQVVGNRLQHLV